MKTAGLSRARDIRMCWKEMQTQNSLWGSWPTPSLSLFEQTLLYLQCTLLSFIHGLSYYTHRLDTTDTIVQYLHKHTHTLYTRLSMPVADTASVLLFSIFDTLWYLVSSVTPSLPCLWHSYSSADAHSHLSGTQTCTSVLGASPNGGCPSMPLPHHWWVCVSVSQKIVHKLTNWKI